MRASIFYYFYLIYLHVLLEHLSPLALATSRLLHSGHFSPVGLFEKLVLQSG